jgi:short-subunit dehydrogenase
MCAVFHENVVIITGASQGIGRELARQLATQGAWLALAARNTEMLDQTAALCRTVGGRALVVPADVTDAVQCERLVAQTVAVYGRVDTLVNNAGIGMWSLFADVRELSIFESIMRVNYLGSVYCTFHALSHLKRARGRLVGVNSLSGRLGVPTRSGYAASKHALAGFFDSLRIELARDGVTVTLLYPGFVATGIRERNFRADGTPVGAGNSPVHENEIMTVEECCRRIVRAMERRERETYFSLRDRLSQWARLIAPGLTDRMVRRSVERGK